MLTGAYAGSSRPRGKLALQVGFIGSTGRSWLGSWVEGASIEPDWAGSLVKHTPNGLDLLVVDPAPKGFDAGRLRELVAEARGLGARIVGLDLGDSTVWEERVDLRLTFDGSPAEAQTLSIVRPIDPRVINPIGFQRVVDRGLAAISTSHKAPPESRSEALMALDRLSRGEEVDVFELDRAAGVNGTDSEFAALLQQLRQYRGVLDDPGLHRGRRDRAAALVRLLAAGIPVALTEPEPELRSALGHELAAALESMTPEQFADPDSRERASVSLRRLALREHSLNSTWRAIARAVGLSVPPRPRVSVVLATKRPHLLERSVRQVSKQTYEPRELVLVLHGDGFSSDHEQRLAREARVPMKIVQVKGERSLGDALNAGTEAASGELIAKMDDDDWYSSDHLWDLVLALEYSGAELVGKRGEFVNLRRHDNTTRRVGGREAGDSEIQGNRVAGAALMIAKRSLASIGGWAPVKGGVDLSLIDSVLRAGGRIHRTHGFGFVVNRHDEGHTWSESHVWFLSKSHVHRRGLALEFASVEEGAREDGLMTDPVASARPDSPSIEDVLELVAEIRRLRAEARRVKTKAKRQRENFERRLQNWERRHVRAKQAHMRAARARDKTLRQRDAALRQRDAAIGRLQAVEGTRWWKLRKLVGKLIRALKSPS